MADNTPKNFNNLKILTKILSFALGFSILFLSNTHAKLDKHGYSLDVPTIFDFCSYGELAKVKSELAADPKLITSRHEKTNDSLLLHCARKHDNDIYLDILKFLISKGASHKDTSTYDGTNLLHHLVQDQRYFNLFVQFLNKNDLDVHAKDVFGRTPLFYAFMRNNKGAIDLLSKKGAILDIKDTNGDTVLHLMTKASDAPFIKLAIKMGAQINEKNNTGETALHKAYKIKELAVMNLLLELNADPNVSDNTGIPLLVRATIDKSIDVVQTLMKVSHQINENIKLHALIEACRGNSIEIANLLIQNRVNLNKSHNEEYPLFAAIMPSSKKLALLKLLTENGADLSVKNKHGSTALGLLKTSLKNAEKMHFVRQQPILNGHALKPGSTPPHTQQPRLALAPGTNTQVIQDLKLLIAYLESQGAPNISGNEPTTQTAALIKPNESTPQKRIGPAGVSVPNQKVRNVFTRSSIPQNSPLGFDNPEKAKRLKK